MQFGRNAFHSMNIPKTFHFIWKPYRGGKVSRTENCVRVCVCWGIYANINNSELIIAWWNWEVCLYWALNSCNATIFCHSDITALCIIVCWLEYCAFVIELQWLYAGWCTSLTMQINLLITKLPKIFFLIWTVIWYNTNQFKWFQIDALPALKPI